MDSLRWDAFNMADAPSLRNHAKYTRVHSRAALTPLSMFGFMMNETWYESNGAVPVPWLPRWIWIPRELQKRGYYTALITPNPMMRLYGDVFSRGFDEYLMYNSLCSYGERMVDRVKAIYESVTKPKYVFLLFMETHMPYPYEKGLGQDFYDRKMFKLEDQVRSVEHLDRQFARMKGFISGTDTDVLVFSDHGELFPSLEGIHGHSPTVFHEKLFEVPLGRAMV